MEGSQPCPPPPQRMDSAPVVFKLQPHLLGLLNPAGPWVAESEKSELGPQNFLFFFFFFWPSHDIWCSQARDQIQAVATATLDPLTQCARSGIEPAEVLPIHCARAGTPKFAFLASFFCRDTLSRFSPGPWHPFVGSRRHVRTARRCHEVQLRAQQPQRKHLAFANPSGHSASSYQPCFLA